MSLQEYYTYLIASLPMLHEAIRPPFTYEQFLDKCQGLIPEKDFVFLSSIREFNESLRDQDMCVVAKKLRVWDKSLRNELVKLRAERLHIVSEKYAHQEELKDQSVSHVAVNAFRNPSIIEGEKTLDSARWAALEEFERGHYFDLDFLVAYAYKLLILERWERIRVSNKNELLDKALS